MATRTVREDSINGNPNRQGGIAVHIPSLIRHPLRNTHAQQTDSPRELLLMQSAVTPLLPR